MRSQAIFTPADLSRSTASMIEGGTANWGMSTEILRAMGALATTMTPA